MGAQARGAGRACAGTRHHPLAALRRIAPAIRVPRGHNTDMRQRRNARYGLRILVANSLAALVIVGFSGGFSGSVPAGALARAMGVSLVYSNSVGTLLALAMPRVADRCFNRGSGARWTILFAAICIVALAGTFVANVVLFAVGYIPAGRFREWMLGSIVTSLVISLVFGGAVTAYETLRHRLEDATVALRTKERDEAEAHRLAAEAQLASLESRVQPHFLFNTLNSIAALIHEDPQGAEKMTGQLASLLRSSLDHQAPLVSVDDEVRIVRDYLEIERVRFGDRLRYDVRVDDDARQARIPRLALQTLVENSVKYAVSPNRDGASIAVRAMADTDRVRIEVEDDGPGFDASAAAQGHGLALVRSRLAMTFGDRASLHVDRDHGRTRVWFDVPAEPRPMNDEPRTANDEPRTTNHEPRTTNHELRTTNHEPRTSNDAPVPR
jgi:signal transduction histidine kinase